MNGLSPLPPPAPPPLPRSHADRIVGGLLLSIFSGSILTVGLGEIARGKVEPGSYGALVMMVGLTLLGLGFVASGIKGRRDSRAAIAKAKEHLLLEVAARNGGQLTVPLASLHLNVPVEQAKQMLDALALKGAAEVRVADDASLVYELPGLGPPRPRLRAPSEGPASGRGAEDDALLDEEARSLEDHASAGKHERSRSPR